MVSSGIQRCAVATNAGVRAEGGGSPNDQPGDERDRIREWAADHP